MPTDRDSRATPTRVAFLVYNDVYSDTRVLKIAATVAAAGAEVRIFAFSSRYGRFGPGLEQRDGFAIERVPLTELRHVLPALGRAVRRMRPGRRPVTTVAAPASGITTSGTAANSTTASTAPASAAAPTATAAATPAPRPPQGLKARVIDLWGRFDLTVRAASFRRRAATAVRDWAPDLVHAHDANTLRTAMAAAGRGIPLVYDSHELWRHRNVRQDRPIGRIAERITERRGARRAGLVVTVSPSIATWLQREYRLPETPILVRNIPPAQPLPDAASGRLRELAGLAASDTVLAYCGGITTNRGIEQSIEALAHLDASVHLVMLGFGSDRYLADLRALAAARGVADRVHEVGAVASDDVSAALADADLSLVLIRPQVLSYEYSLPNKLFESIHAGLAVLGNDLPDTAAIIREWGVGTVVPVEATPAQLADRIREALAGSSEFRANSRAAAAELTWEGEAARLLSGYRRLLGSGTSLDAHP